MDKKLKELTVAELLRKFGAGNHKPGSGSAAAFNGMMAAKMLLTVITLTNEPKRTSVYGKSRERFLALAWEIETKLFPRLEILFEEDSVQFGQVFDLRTRRDAELDPLKKRVLSDQEKAALRISTETPLAIAELCLQLVELGTEVFDHGFRSARGDAAVAINDALAGVGSSLSIVALNLLSLPSDTWMDMILDKSTDVRTRYDKMGKAGLEKLDTLHAEVKAKRIYHQAMAPFLIGNLATTIRTDEQLEALAIRFQNELWTHRKFIWKKDTPSVAIDVIQPRAVLERVLGYAYYESPNLGTHEISGMAFETAGIIDKSTKSVQISTKFPPNSQRFSLAHELAHAILHHQTVQHRDRSIDGLEGADRSPEELQADKFAAYFLLPRKAVRQAFERTFKLKQFEINEANALMLGLPRPSDLRKLCKDRRGLARLLAQVNRILGMPVTSMVDVFGVSVETMAIRLEDLGLLIF